MQRNLEFIDNDKIIKLNKLGNAAITYKNTHNILTKASGFINTYDYTLNPYSGCSFGCTYCYAAFFSNNENENTDNWGKWIEVKENALALLNNYRPGTLDNKLIYMSSATDPYQPLEKKLELTKSLLKCFINKRHKIRLVVQTRSPLVVRDCDLFKDIINLGGKVQINMTVTTDDEIIRKAFEPLCTANNVRLKGIKDITKNNNDINTYITMTPLLIVSNIDNFINKLLNTGVQRFIIQPFHFNTGKFIAQTRQQAIDVIINKLDCNINNYQEEYLKHYNNNLQQFKDKLPNLGEGKDGFAPRI